MTKDEIESGGSRRVNDDIHSCSAECQRPACVTYRYMEAAYKRAGVAFDINITSKREMAQQDDDIQEYKRQPVQPQQEPVLQDIEQYRLQMAGISTAAIGYWKEGDVIHPDYNTLALRDVAKLYAKYDELYKAQPITQAIPQIPQEHSSNEPVGKLQEPTVERAWFTIAELNAWANKKILENPQWVMPKNEPERDETLARPERSMKVEGPLHVICQCDKCKPQIAFNAEVVGYVASQRTWVGLTDEDTFEIGERLGLADVAWIDLMKAIEAKLKEKNT